MEDWVGNAAETYKENQVNADKHVKQKFSYVLYCYSSRNGRITLFFPLAFFSLISNDGNDEHAHKIRQRNTI